MARLTDDELLARKLQIEELCGSFSDIPIVYLPPSRYLLLFLYFTDKLMYLLDDGGAVTLDGGDDEDLARRLQMEEHTVYGDEGKYNT